MVRPGIGPMSLQIGGRGADLLIPWFLALGEFKN